MKDYEKVIKAKIKELEKEIKKLKEKRNKVDISSNEFDDITRETISSISTALVLYEILN